MTPKQRRYYSYLLRIWEVDGAETPIWRASLEDPHTGEQKGFADLESLFAFLRERADGGSEKDER